MKVDSNVSCRELIDRVNDYLERRVGHEARAAMEQHLLICVGCARYVEGIECTTALARQLGRGDAAAEAPPGDRPDPAEAPGAAPSVEKPMAAFRAFQAKRRGP